MISQDSGPGQLGTVCVQSHGCKLNQADSDALARRFLEAGYRLAGPSEPIDIYVLNTCTVTHVADRKARRALRTALRNNPSALVLATGCYAQRAPEELASVQGVARVVSNFDKDRLVELVLAQRGGPPVTCTVGEDTPVLPVGRTRAMVKIQEGCNQVCAYCIVPKVRGRERSLHPQVLLREVKNRVEEGYKEVVLTGTQLGSYGFDLTGVNLRDLVELLLKETAVERLRVSSLQPQEITPDLLELWKEPRLCPHFHIPLQSGSGCVLYRMRRRYTSAEYAIAVERVRANVPGVSITTDVIVGFPGEEEQHFEESLRFAEGMQFASMHVFPYSVRPGTSAAYMGPKVTDRVKRRRMGEMLIVAQEQGSRFRRGSLGSIRKVLWERSDVRGGKPISLGLTDNYLKVHTEQDTPTVGLVTSAHLRAEAGESILVEVV